MLIASEVENLLNASDQAAQSALIQVFLEANLLSCNLSQLYAVNRLQPAASYVVHHRNGGEWEERGWGSAVFKEDTFWLRPNPCMWALSTPTPCRRAALACSHGRRWRKHENRRHMCESQEICSWAKANLPVVVAALISETVGGMWNRKYNK